MQNFLRFSDYDIFGYLVSGLLLMAAADIVFDSQLVLNPEWTVSWVAFIIISGYVVGHIVSELTTFVFDRLIVRGIWGTTASHVMRRMPDNWQRRWYHSLCGEYFVPIPSEVRKRAIARAGLSPEEEASPTVGEILFWRAWPEIKRQPIPYARLDTFLKLYGFCRSISFVTLIAAALFAYDAAHRYCQGLEYGEQRACWALLALVTSMAMFIRYLRFLRLYSVEVFSTYAESPQSNDG